MAAGLKRKAFVAGRQTVVVRDPAVEFAAHHLGGRVMPDDLRRLLNLLEYEPASRRAKCLNRLGVVFPESDRLPALIDAECRGRDDLEGITRLAYAQAMADMVRYSGFVAETVDGSAIGYWFGPDQIQIEAARLMRFDKSGSFSGSSGNRVGDFGGS
jgi:hypothetical protein